MGPGIQGNREGLTTAQFYVYNVFDIQRGDFLTPPERRNLIEQMNAEHAKDQGENPLPILLHVPVYHEAITLDELGIKNMDDLLAYAVGPSLNNAVREGVVFKAVDGRHQFKAISNLYLEQEK
jgi:ATP-dependent RNA circularization protein (DNA/RNA ligase family)